MGIVIVDDSATNLIVLKRLAVNELSVPVLTYACPLEALAYLEANQADIIFVDCEMPKMNGVDFIKAVRAQWLHAGTPVIMVTRHSDSEIRRQALSAGASEFLTKPVDGIEFKIRLLNHLKRSEAEHSASEKILLKPLYPLRQTGTR